MGGLIYAMAGGTIAHGQLAAKAIALLGRATAGRCVLLTSDVKVRIDSTDFSGFPDATVVCGPIQRSRIDAHAVTNPSLVVEVTSRSTEDYDRGEKLLHYQAIPGLKAVLLVSHRERRVTLVAQHEGRWGTRDVEAPGLLTLDSPGLELDVAALYEDVGLEP